MPSLITYPLLTFALLISLAAGCATMPGPAPQAIAPSPTPAPSPSATLQPTSPPATPLSTIEPLTPTAKPPETARPSPEIEEGMVPIPADEELLFDTVKAADLAVPDEVKEKVEAGEWEKRLVRF